MCINNSRLSDKTKVYSKQKSVSRNPQLLIAEPLTVITNKY